MNIAIIERGLAEGAVKLVFLDGAVNMLVRGTWKKASATAEEYKAIWDAAHELDLRDCRAMASTWLPKSLQQKWDLRVYVGPSASGRTNVVIMPFALDINPLESLKGIARESK